jgi:GNAT superfamily N-acetyltransferase
MPLGILIRSARPDDVPGLRTLIESSVRRLQANDYTFEQREAALRTVYGVDSQLVADGTYLLAEAVDAGETPIAGCGGWSRHKTLFGGDAWTDREDTLLDPRHDAAKIRAFFVHPDQARRGVGTALLAACEAGARAAGFTRCEMGATLTGARLFGAKGYRALETIQVPLGDGLTMPVVRMEKIF